MVRATLLAAEETDLQKALVRESSAPKVTFAEVYRDGFPFVWRNLRRLGVLPESVKDAVQDVFLIVHRRFSTYDGTASVNTWLFGIAMRVAHNYRRAAKRKASHSAPPPATPYAEDPINRAVAREASPFERVEAAEANRLLMSLLDELDDERRVVFVLTELEQMSAPEISVALGLNLNTVYGRLRAARQQFEQALVRYRAQEQRRIF
jgi:RNA polymerase sigma-70 factor (ECF subfamily)